MKKEVYKNLNVIFNTEHEVDAFALAILGHYAIISKYDNEKQKETIKIVLDDKSKQNYIRRIKR